MDIEIRRRLNSQQTLVTQLERLPEETGTYQTDAGDIALNLHNHWRPIISGEVIGDSPAEIEVSGVNGIGMSELKDGATVRVYVHAANSRARMDSRGSWHKDYIGLERRPI